MQRISRLAFSASLLLLAAPAGAQSTPATADTPAPRVEIVTDQQNGAVRIVIDGKDVAVIDGEGLHVAGSVTYSGTMTDTGDGAHAE